MPKAKRQSLICRPIRSNFQIAYFVEEDGDEAAFFQLTEFLLAIFPG